MLNISNVPDVIAVAVCVPRRPPPAYIDDDRSRSNMVESCPRRCPLAAPIPIWISVMDEGNGRVSPQKDPAHFAIITALR